MSHNNKRLDPLAFVGATMSAMGVSLLDHKVDHQHSIWFKCLVALVALDLIEGITVIIVASFHPELALVLGDPGIVLIGPHYRHLMSFIAIGMRLQAVCLLVNYLADDHAWLVNSSDDYVHLAHLCIDTRLLHFSRHLVWLHHLAITGALPLFGTAIVSRHFAVGFELAHLPGFLYLVGYCCLLSHNIFTFYLEYILIVQMNFIFARQMNGHLKTTSLRARHPKPAVIIKTLEHYSTFYVMTHRSSGYLRRCYAITVTWTLVGLLPNFYSFRIVEITLILKIILMMMILWYTATILIISFMNGRIDLEMKWASNAVYERFTFGSNLARALSFTDRVKVRAFFDCLDRHTFGFSIFDTPINLRATVSIFTIYLTLLALFKKQLQSLV